MIIRVMVGGISSLRMILLRVTTWENMWDIEALIRGLRPWVWRRVPS